MRIPGGDVDVELVEATSMIHFIDTPMYEVRIFGSAMLIAFGINIYLMYRFSTLEAICRALDCQPGDILEYVREPGSQED